MTRFLAFYMDRTSDYVGPIRSARPTDPTMVRPYGGILLFLVQLLVYSSYQRTWSSSFRRSKCTNNV